MQPDTLKRHDDLDWLRVIATLTVFLFHGARFFDQIPWEVKNAEQSLMMTLLVALLAQWLMPFFFLLSGISMALALRVRTAGQLLRERFMRILLPYLTVGILLLIPPQEYIAALTRGDLDPRTTFPQFYLHYLSHLRLFGDDFPWLALPQMHLWYLLYLFVFSLLLLPLLLGLRTERGQRVIEGVARACALPGVIFLAALPVTALMSLLDPQGWGRDNGGWPYLIYPILIIYGFVLYANDRFTAVIQQNGIIALGLVGITTPFTLLLLGAYLDNSIAYGTLNYALFVGIRALNSWSWMIGLLYLGQTFLTKRTALLRYTSEAALPFYLLHQTIIVIIAFLIVDWHLPIFPKYLLLISSAFLIIVASYELLIRRVHPLRVLFGLRPQVRSHATTGAISMKKSLP